MILITSDYNVINSMNPYSTIVIVVGEDFNPAMSNTKALVNLTNALPPSEIIYEYLNDISVHGYFTAANAAIAQYEDYLMSNSNINDTFLMLPIVGLHKQIVIYLSNNDMGNKDFPFVDVLINYMSNLIRLEYRRDLSDSLIELQFSQFSAISVATLLFSNNRISIDNAINIIRLSENKIDPILEYNLLIERYGQRESLISGNCRTQIAKEILIDKMLGKPIVSYNIPALLW